MNEHEKFMKKAIAAAHESGKQGDYPIGAVIVKDGEVISVGYETLKSANDPVNGHAEIDAIRKATREILKQPYLEGCVLYSSHEPCPMCATAAFWAKIETIVYSVSRDDMVEQMAKKVIGKFSWRQVDIPCKEILNQGRGHIVKLIPGVLREEGLKLFDYTV
ncbi:MAG: nucleoside deaminase [Candidatus Pacebacteria bacterium]|nr:nucleoside deaminase [Candidatus Paceibacterota bacterium]